MKLDKLTLEEAKQIVLIKVRINQRAAKAIGLPDDPVDEARLTRIAKNLMQIDGLHAVTVAMMLTDLEDALAKVRC